MSLRKFRRGAYVRHRDAIRHFLQFVDGDPAGHFILPAVGRPVNIGTLYGLACFRSAGGGDATNSRRRPGEIKEGVRK